MSEEPIQTYRFYPGRMGYGDSWDDVSRLVEHLEALGRTYTIRKHYYEKHSHASQYYTYRVWWWPFKRTGTRMVPRTEMRLLWTVEEMA